VTSYHFDKKTTPVRITTNPKAKAVLNEQQKST
jgi:hypothetical protein